MTKTELGNYDVLKAIKEQLENNQDKTITVVATVGELDFTEEITIPKEAWDKIVESAAYEVKCSIEDEEGPDSDITPDVAYHLCSRGITIAGILDQCSKLEELRNSMLVLQTKSVNVMNILCLKASKISRLPCAVTMMLTRTCQTSKSSLYTMNIRKSFLMR